MPWHCWVCPQWRWGAPPARPGWGSGAWPPPGRSSPAPWQAWCVSKIIIMIIMLPSSANFQHSWKTSEFFNFTTIVESWESWHRVTNRFYFSPENWYPYVLELRTSSVWFWLACLSSKQNWEKFYSSIEYFGWTLGSLKITAAAV